MGAGGATDARIGDKAGGGGGCVTRRARIADWGRGVSRTFPNVHANGGNTAPSCALGVATILSTTSFTDEGCKDRGGAGIGSQQATLEQRWCEKVERDGVGRRWKAGRDTTAWTGPLLTVSTLFLGGVTFTIATRGARLTRPHEAQQFFLFVFLDLRAPSHLTVYRDGSGISSRKGLDLQAL